MDLPKRNWKEHAIESAILTYLTGRAAVFTLEFETMDRLIGLLPKSQRVIRKGDPKLKTRLMKEIFTLLKKDAQLFARRTLELKALIPEPLKSHRTRLFKLIQDGRNLYRRRKNHENRNFENLSPHLSTEELKAIPDYYYRNYHFQTDGYLSEASAELYDHQVDMLFSGTTDAMRRSWISPFVELRAWEPHASLKILDVACGTGSSTQVLRSLFQNSEILGVDLSPPYIRHCTQRFNRQPHPPRFQTEDFRQSSQASHTYDLVNCTFLFHELPRGEREKVLGEAFRVLKSGGYLIIVDAIQKSADEAWLNPLLEDFPVNYHEPFFKDYAQTPMEDLIEKAGFELIRTERAFMSRYWVCRKA